MLEAVSSLAVGVQLERAQQGVLQLPQGKASVKPDRAAPSTPDMHGLAATMQLLHQIDLETAGRHADAPQLPTVFPSHNASQQPSAEQRAAADPAAGDDSWLLDSSAPAEAAGMAEHQNAGRRRREKSSAGLAEADAVQQSEAEEAQESSAGSHQAKGLQQQADSIEEQSQLRPAVQDLPAEDSGSIQSREAQDSCTNGSHDAASWGVREQTSYELEGEFLAGVSV